jgi:hypothetical protein
MAFNTHYTRFTYQQMIEDFTNRLRSDEKFKKLSAASIYQMFMEMLTGTIDMTNFYMQRVAEESFMHTAKLDSSIIKHAATLGYSPKKPTPAEVEVAIVLRGPLPAELQAGATVYFSQEDVKLSFNGNPYILATDYSYTFTAEDINDGRDNSSWSKTIVMSKKAENMKWLPLAGIKYYKAGDVQPIKAYQAEFADVEIKGVSNLRKLGKNYQFYDINDLEFSNWFGRRDPSSYNYGRYVKHSGYTKIGIGKTKDEAFNSDGSNLYDIEDYSIFLNPDVLANDMPKSPLKVCAVTTNSDKTTRIQFGDGILVDNGLSVNSDNIYVRYLKTRGATANTVGTTGSMFQCSTDFFATQAGSIVDISSNVQILLNSDITAGADFESALSIKNHAPLYYAAAGRLITKNDFESYFTSLTTPIKVKNASAWGQDEVEALGTNGTVTYKYLQNVVLYCLAASTYNINGKLNSVRNVLDDEDETFGAFTVYGSGTKYLEHLTDYIKLLLSTKSFDTQQYAKNPSQQWQKNVKKIRENVQDKMLIGTKLYSMPPFVQYFDVVGTVEVDSLSKLQQYKIDVENKIYEWLDESTTFRKPIYKADIIKFFNERPETKSVNLDIKVSELIKSDKSTFSFAVGPNSGLYSINRNLPGAPDRDYIDKDEGCYQNYNTITIPKTDANNASISVDAFKNKNIIVSLNNGGTEVNKFQFTPYEVSETSTNFILSMYGYQTSQVQQIADDAVFYISVAGSADFASTSNLSISNAAAYGLDANQTEAVIADVKEWMNACKPALTQADRPIHLPYTIETMDEVTRDETIYRLGSVQQGDLEKELTEKSFWQHFVPYLINKYYGHDSLKGELLEQSVNGDLWNGITNLVLDIYRQMKVVFCDSILDDNNNIIDYSMDNELPVVRLNITYKYRA